MEIVRIERKQKTEREDYTLITFKETYYKWFKKKTRTFTETCITPNWNIGTDFAKTGRSIETSLWDVVKSFLNTGDDIHEY